MYNYAVATSEQLTSIGILFVTFTRPTRKPEAYSMTFEIDEILPPPFEWANIPAGATMMLDATDEDPPGTPGGDFYVEPFAVSKYPITNPQYQAFLDAPDGYFDPRWWQFSASSRHWYMANRIPKKTSFPGPELPRTNVSWYDAMAFCRWMSFKIGRNITLPTERQWQRAAQGDDYRNYPWGDVFAGRYCNAGEAGPGQPTPVTWYEDGVSPFDVMDMAGNVYEWCLDEWETGQVNIQSASMRVLRGGSFFDTPADAKITKRHWSFPFLRGFNWGFRICKDRVGPFH